MVYGFIDEGINWNIKWKKIVIQSHRPGFEPHLHPSLTVWPDRQVFPLLPPLYPYWSNGDLSSCLEQPIEFKKRGNWEVHFYMFTL